MSPTEAQRHGENLMARLEAVESGLTQLSLELEPGAVRNRIDCLVRLTQATQLDAKVLITS